MFDVCCLCVLVDDFDDYFLLAAAAFVCVSSYSVWAYGGEYDVQKGTLYTYHDNDNLLENVSVRGSLCNIDICAQLLTYLSPKVF